MTLLQALILGIVQGITEFFPVSSSAHLRIFKRFFGIADGEHLLYFDLLCHAGTLLALLIYMRRDVWKVLTSLRQIGLFTVALLPLVPAYFLLKPVRIALSNPSYLGYFLILTGALLFAASRKTVLAMEGGPAPPLELSSGNASCCHRGCAPAKKNCSEASRTSETFLSLRRRARRGDFSQPQPAPLQKLKDVLWIGVSQSMALIPGISRSGSTIVMARFCGWSWGEAARFSFLLAVPTILGGEFLESWKLVNGSSESLGALPWTSYAAGFGTSFGMGLIAVRAMFKIYERGRVDPFARYCSWYCFGAGAFALAIFHG